MQTAPKIIDTTVREIEQTNTMSIDVEQTDATSSELEQANTIAQALIAQRAYEKWQQRGCPIGDDFQDWFAAQSEFEAEDLEDAEHTDIERVAC